MTLKEYWSFFKKLSPKKKWDEIVSHIFSMTGLYVFFVIIVLTFIYAFVKLFIQDMSN